jgi:hypothetical protein
MGLMERADGLDAAVLGHLRLFNNPLGTGSHVGTVILGLSGVAGLIAAMTVLSAHPAPSVGISMASGYAILQSLLSERARRRARRRTRTEPSPGE